MVDDPNRSDEKQDFIVNAHETLDPEMTGLEKKFPEERARKRVQRNILQITNFIAILTALTVTGVNMAGWKRQRDLEKQRFAQTFEDLTKRYMTSVSVLDMTNSLLLASNTGYSKMNEAQICAIVRAEEFFFSEFVTTNNSILQIKPSTLEDPLLKNEILQMQKIVKVHVKRADSFQTRIQSNKSNFPDCR